MHQVNTELGNNVTKAKIVTVENAGKEIHFNMWLEDNRQRESHISKYRSPGTIKKTCINYAIYLIYFFA